jgi:CRISPR-associated protein Cas1
LASLYVVQQNAKLRIHNRRLQVDREDDDGEVHVLHSVPLGQVSQVVLFGNVGLTTPAIDCLLGQETEVVFLTQNGEYRGRLLGSLSPHVPLRRAQYRHLDRPDFVLKMAQQFVRAKIVHQRALLMRHNREKGDAIMTAAADQLKNALAGVEHKTLLSFLRGLEGASSAAYFGGFRRLFASEWNFSDRNRRPPADPVNVLLSFGYTLLAQAAGSAVQVVGLDPYAGFLHEYVYNRPALALDLMEEFRPVVDGIVLWACRSGQVIPGHFSPGPPERPVVLEEEGKRRFLLAYEQRMNQEFTHPGRGVKMPLRQCLIEQARQIGACLQNDTPGYAAMGFK